MFPLLVLLSFFLFLSFHDSSPCVCSRHVYLRSLLCIFTHTHTLSLSHASSVQLILLLEKSPSLTFRVFEKKILVSFLHPFFVKLFLFYLRCCFAPFFLLFFSIVFVRTRYIDSFFFGRITTCLNHHKNLFSEFLLFDVNKSVIVLLLFFWKFLFQRQI